MTSSAAISLGLPSGHKRQDFLRRYERLFLVTTILVSAVPGLAPLKLAAILALWLYLMLGDSFSIAAALWFVSVALNLLIGVIVGAVFQGVPSKDVFDHGLRILVFFISLAVGTFAATHLHISQKRLDQLIFLVAAGLMLFKMIIVAAVFAGVPLERMQALFGFDTVTSGIGFGLQRLQFPSDIITPFLIACYRGGQSRLRDSILLVCIVSVILLSFSRYLFGFYLLCTFVRAFWIRKADFITMLNLAISIACVAAFFNTILSRFASEETSISDQIRVDQIHYLKIGIHNFPLLGTGIGSKAHDYLRSEKFPYFYEAQWYATAMQMGYIGVSWYIANLLLAVYVPLRRNFLPFTIVLLAWAASGFTNPFLTALGSAFGLTLLLVRCNITPRHQPNSEAIA